MVRSRIKFKRFNIILSFLMIIIFIHNFIFFSVPMFLMGDGVVLGGPNSFQIQLNIPTFNEVESFKNFAKLAVLTACSFLMFKLLVNLTRKAKIDVLNNIKSDQGYNESEGKVIDLLDSHNPFLYSCKVQALRN